MTALHFIRDHWLRIAAAWFVVSVLVVAIYSTFAIVYGESDEARDARRRKARVESARRNLRRNIQWLAAQEKAKQARESERRVDAIVTEVMSDISTPQRAREVEGADEADRNNTDYLAASDGRHVA